ncbi:MAG: methylase [Pseudoalteromonadaceae bacterium]|nr:methylase [Pseudoalteromonadaceae bacterium]OUX92846.1 MAG: methylase [Pseudoalteromonas sp. TMED43]|tara:strand:+ start:3377 stop:3967 length:591 start_codon:yes stop_codon:yes gene_type:complete
MIKPFSQACENNKGPILEVLKTVFNKTESVLEIGSGTGQHSVFFAEQLPHLQWYTSDRHINHEGINLWLKEANLTNLHGPLELDLNYAWPVNNVDAIYTANTFHIVSWQLVEQFLKGVSTHLVSQGVVCIYGPFKYQGQFTSASNEEFDRFLTQRDPFSGIRDFEAIEQLATQAGLTLISDTAMPANNQLLVFKRQ